MEYEIPNPKENPIAAIVIYFKVLKGIEYHNRDWDKIHFARCSRSAKHLLKVCETFSNAKACLDEISENFNEKDLAWTLETVVKHAHDFVLKRRKVDVAKVKSEFLNALTQLRSDNALKIEGTVNGAEMVKSLGNLKVFQSTDGDKKRIGDSQDGRDGKQMGQDPLEAEEA